ncbi:MAG: Arm DNA-binding domain-containing protein [Clostridia bacterium]
MNNYNIKSTFIRKRNNNYNVYIEYIDENGKTKQKSQGSYKTKKDADRHLIEIKSSINNNKVIIAKNITIVDRCLKYIEDNYKDASPHTVLNRKSWIKNNIQTFFEGTLLGDVSPSQVQLFLNGLFDKYTVESSKVRYGFLRGVLAEAYRLREIPENPCNFVKMPNKKDTFEGDVYTK